MSVKALPNCQDMSARTTPFQFHFSISPKDIGLIEPLKAKFRQSYSFAVVRIALQEAAERVGKRDNRTLVNQLKASIDSGKGSIGKKKLKWADRLYGRITGDDWTNLVSVANAVGLDSNDAAARFSLRLLACLEGVAKPNEFEV